MTYRSEDPSAMRPDAGGDDGSSNPTSIQLGVTSGSFLLAPDLRLMAIGLLGADGTFLSWCVCVDEVQASRQLVR